MGVKGKHRIAPFMSSDSPRSSRLDVVTRGGSEQQEITFQIFTMKAESDKCERPGSILKKTENCISARELMLEDWALVVLSAPSLFLIISGPLSILLTLVPSIAFFFMLTSTGNLRRPLIF